MRPTSRRAAAISFWRGYAASLRRIWLGRMVPAAMVAATRRMSAPCPRRPPSVARPGPRRPWTTPGRTLHPPRASARGASIPRTRASSWLRPSCAGRVRAGADPRTHRGRSQGRAGSRTQGRQEVRAVESPGAAGSGRDGPPRHVGVRTVPPTRHQAGDALQVRRTAGPVA